MIEMKNPKIPNPTDLHSSYSNPMGDSKLLNMKTMEVDKPLCAIGFEHDVISASLVSGHLLITENCTQVCLNKPSSSSIAICQIDRCWVDFTLNVGFHFPAI